MSRQSLLQTTTLFIALGSVLALGTTPTHAVDLFELAKLSESTPADGDEFGYAVATDNGAAFITARADGEGSATAGWVRLFDGQGAVWTRGAALSAGDSGATKRFGESINVAGNYLIVGSPRNSTAGTYSGSAYVFYHNAGAWAQQARLVSSDAIAYDEFGAAVTLDGDYALVGARSDDDGGSQSGSVYVFQRNGTSWPQKYKMVASDDEARDKFGSSIDLEGDYTLIGAPGDDSSTGSAYVFLRSGTPWYQQTKLTASDRSAGDLFGTAVSLSGTLAAVGAPGDDNGAGAVYLFERDGTTWTPVNKLVLSGRSAGDAFGQAIALYGDRMLVGAPGRANGAGRAYLYALYSATWIPLVTYTTSDAQTGAALGGSVALDAAHVVVGAAGLNGGAAYVFSNIALDCNANGIPDVCDTTCAAINPLTGFSCQAITACGQRDDCNLNRIPDECEPDCNTNGVPDDCDTSFGASVDCNTNSVPDECEPDCNANGVADACDLADGLDTDCNTNGIPDACEAYDDVLLLDEDFESGAFPAGWSATGLWHVTTQCAVHPVCDGAGWAYYGLDAQCDFDTGAVNAGALTSPTIHLPATASRAVLRYCSVYEGERGVAPDGHDAAWVEINGAIVDDVGATFTTRAWNTRTIDLRSYIGQDITIQWRFDSDDASINGGLGWQIDHVALEVDSDCNGNGAPDACDIASGVSADCNTNGLPDECDLALGSATDCNANDVLDACETAADCNANGVLDVCEPLIVYLDANAAGADDGTSWSDAYPELRTAIAETTTECLPVELWVAAGTYAPADAGGDQTASFDLRNNLALYGGFVGDETQRSQRNADPATNATILSGDLDGGGPSGNCYHVVNASGVDSTAVLDGFTITDGDAHGAYPHDRGAAITMTSAQPTIRNCLITGNSGYVGAVAGNASAPRIEDCTILDNTATYGAGTYWEAASAPILRRCKILGNSATGALSFGGGLYASANSEPRLYNCTISGNTSGHFGGGLHVQSGSKPHLINCTVSRNSAADAGGGLYAGTNTRPRVVNSIFWANSDPGGIDESAQIHVYATATLSARYSCIAGWTGALGGNAILTIDPVFIDADGPDNVPGTADDDLHLANNSPCIDAGSNGASTEQLDLDRWPRRVDIATAPELGAGDPPLVDMGAHEVQSDCNQNGVADPEDIAGGLSRDCNANDRPDECEIDAASIAPGGPFYCVSNCDADCNSNGVPDACDIAAGTSGDCTDDGVPDECDGDCDGDGIANVCEIAAGSASDCDENGVPDACELDGNDCDGDGVLDRCRLANPYVLEISPQYAPLEFSVDHTFFVPAPEPAVSAVFLDFIAQGDLNAPAEIVEVLLNGQSIGTVFESNGVDCSVGASADALELTPEVFNDLVAGGDATFTMVPSTYVEDSSGCNSYIQMSLRYLVYRDCNGNAIPDRCEPDCNTNGTADECDIDFGSAADCDGNRVPDECDLAAGGDSDGNGVLDACEADCDANGVPDECDISCAATVHATGEPCATTYADTCGLETDCNANGVPDACDPDCNANGIADDCEAADDCNLNAIPDECEIPLATPGGPFFCTQDCALDCNGNGLPDECEIDASTPGGAYFCTDACDPDCNLNGVPDACDIAAGTEPDCNANAIPDVCEADSDDDGVIDPCDGCPEDPYKTAPLTCGCGASEDDTDGDGVPECVDVCPDTDAGEPVDQTGCPFYGACCLPGPYCDIQSPTACAAFAGAYQGNGTTCATDGDNDGVANCFDECPDDSAKTEPGLCGCGRPDTDLDGDGVPACDDLCPETPLGEAVDADGCPLHGACCLSTGGCSHAPIFTEAYCTSLGHDYQGNGTTCDLGCTPRQLGDYDADGDVDLDDAAVFAECTSGPHDRPGFIAPTALCNLVFDADDDGDIDLADYAAFQQAIAP